MVAVARRRSLSVYHLHMGGPDADASQVRDLPSPMFEARLRQMGAAFVQSAAGADVMLVTGLLTEKNLDAVLAQVAALPSPALVITVGDNATSGGTWAHLDSPALA